MNGASTNATLSNDDDKNLEFLLDVFGSKLSADDMASAYMEAGHNLYKACEILYDMLGSSSNNDRPVSIRDLTAAPVSPAGSMGTVGANGAAYARSGTLQNDSTKVTSRSKPKKSGASMGTISGMIGADYGRSRVPTKKTPEITKPVKLMSHEVPASQIWDEKSQLVKEKNESMNKDVEQFLLQMLGDGFKLDMEVIREVVGGCGYDVHQSLEKLMSMSASTLDLGDATASTMEQTNSTDTWENLSKNYEEKLQVDDSAQRNRSELEKEVLGNLFTVPERCEFGPLTILPRLELRTRKYGIVTGPLEDPITVFKTPIVKKEVHGEGNVEIEDNYESLREAAKEHWTTMKQCYRAAAKAYVEGSKDAADKLVNEGHFYMAKAREVNEMSAKMLTETRDDGEAISINLNDYDPKEARRLLKTQLKIMSGIPSIHYLKVMVGPNDDKTKPHSRKRLITKLLENEKITWAEEQDGQMVQGNLASNTITDVYGLKQLNKLLLNSLFQTLGYEYAQWSLEDLEIIQEKDTHPSIDTSLNHEEDDQEIDELQSDINLIRRSTRTRHAPDRMCLYIDAEEHELGDLDNEVWVLVELPSNGKIIGSKWLFKKKTDMDGVVHTYKTRLVAKGYTQTPGINYEETFSPVADIRAIRILIAIAAYYDYEIWQIDVKTAFHNAYLNEEEKLKLSESQRASTPAELKRMQNGPYASAIGSIMYGVRCTRPDVAFSQNTGYVFVLNGGAIDWKSAKQSIFATSTAEAEYIATFDAFKEAVWVRKFIFRLGVVPTIEEPISMYCDNTRAIAIANESEITKGARHFRAKVHYHREVIKYGDIKLEKVHTDDNLADPFT
nr:hypothetical protein [Tanacetum cinerariifolium]